MTSLSLHAVISLHCPLSPSSTHLIGAAEIRQMKKGVVLINTSRGGLVDTRAAIDGILDGTIGALGMDVYEHEGPLFFRNFTGLSMSQRIQRFDEKMGLLTSLPNVLISPHRRAASGLHDRALTAPTAVRS